MNAPALLPAMLYIAGMAGLLIGERIIGGEAVSRQVLDVAGLLALVAALGMVFQRGSAAPEAQRPAHRTALKYGLLGLAAVGLYAMTTQTVTDAIGFSDDLTETRYRVALTALWAALWMAGTLPFIAAERALAASPYCAVPARISEAAASALGLAFGLSLLLPLNYLASHTNERWDFGYFKTAAPGTSTQNMVGNLDQPITAYLFFSATSDVTQEVRTYFDALDAPLLDVRLVDHALEPDLAKELKVRDNGYVALVRGEGEDQQVERIKIGTEFDKAKRKLKKLDAEVRESVLRLSRGKRTAYFTVGHGEMYWDKDIENKRQLKNIKKVLKALNYKVKELGLAEGLGNEIPEDAHLVVILGPTGPFLPEELKALDTWRAKGGNLLIGLEPDGPDMAGLLAPIGMQYDPSVTLANDTRFIPQTYKQGDRVNIFSNKFSTHGSVTTLSRNSDVMLFIAPGSGLLSELPGSPVKPTITVRALADTWADRDGDLTFDSADEQRKTWPLAMAASGGEGDAEFRVVVVADGTWAADLALVLDTSKANFQFLLDGMSWLGRDEDLAGTVNSEEDVKIQHSREGQGWVFYATSFLLPFGFLGLGMVRLRSRRKRGRQA